MGGTFGWTAALGTDVGTSGGFHALGGVCRIAAAGAVAAGGCAIGAVAVGAVAVGAVAVGIVSVGIVSDRANFPGGHEEPRPSASPAGCWPLPTLRDADASRVTNQRASNKITTTPETIPITTSALANEPLARIASAMTQRNAKIARAPTTTTLGIGCRSTCSTC